ncbi:phosphatase PAP2 family protein [Candidatus Woesearchaeota archaeon]|nr:phosphatase PAP2 family protein [Candidatus Woesearchaeota archaeon]
MKAKSGISPKYMLLIFLGTIAFSFIYYYFGKTFINSPLTYYQYLVFTSVLAVVVTGSYQIFFWVQRNNYFFRTRCLKTRLDDYIPFWPQFIWIYSFSYYLLIGYVAVSINSIEEGVNLIFGGLLLLLLQSICFLLFPCTVPSSWRKYKANSLSTKFLKFVQKLDNGRNCFPSMHCSVATYAGLILLPVMSYYSLIFIFLIAISCLFVKQHQVADILPGILLGWLVYTIIV